MHVEWSEEKFLKGSAGHKNQAMLLKQASNDRSFAHAAGELQIYAKKKKMISTLCLDRFYSSANFSGIVL